MSAKTLIGYFQIPYSRLFSKVWKDYQVKNKDQQEVGLILMKSGLTNKDKSLSFNEKQFAERKYKSNDFSGPLELNMTFKYIDSWKSNPSLLSLYSEF